MKPPIPSCLLVAAYFVCSFVPRAAAESPAAQPGSGSQNLRLVISGGPARADVELEINGQFALLVTGEETQLFHRIDDMLKPGLNQLKVQLKQPETGRTSGEDVRIAISPVVENDRRTRTTGDSLAELVVPADADPAIGCTEVVSFSADPKPPAPTDLKNQYWLFVTGPPARNRVMVTVNGTLVADASAGTQFMEITHAVKKGKNAAQFDVRASCLVSPSGQQGPLQFTIAPAKMDHEVVKMTEPPAAELDIDPKKSEEPRSVKRAFRAW